MPDCFVIKLEAQFQGIFFSEMTPLWQSQRAWFLDVVFFVTLSWYFLRAAFESTLVMKYLRCPLCFNEGIVRFFSFEDMMGWNKTTFLGSS